MSVRIVRIRDVIFNAGRFESAAVVKNVVEDTYDVIVYLQNNGEPIVFKDIIEKKDADTILYQISQQCVSE